MTGWVTVWALLRTEWQYHCCNDSKTSGMKGGPACGSERDITGKSARRSPYFIIPLSFLIGDRGRRGVSSDKARQFQELLCRQITAVHHAALCLSLRLLSPQTSAHSNIPPVRSVRGWICWSWRVGRSCEAEMLEGEVEGQASRKSGQQRHLESVSRHWTLEWRADDPVTLWANETHVTVRWFIDRRLKSTDWESN